MNYSPSFLVLVTLMATAKAFVAPVALVSKKIPTTAVLLHETSIHDFIATTSHFLSQEPSLSSDIGSNVFQNGGGIMDTITSVLTGIIGVVFFLVGLTYVMAAVIIPQAAQQLERQTKELDPELWAKYETQLEPGQTMDQRPDLMQELGEKMQALMEAKFKEQQHQVQLNDENGSDRPKVVDAEIVSKDTSKAGGLDDPWSG